MSYNWTLNGYRAYTTLRGVSTPTLATDVEANASLVRAQDYIQFNFVQRFSPGLDETAPNVEAAVYEAAVLELQTPGFWSRTYTESESKVLVGVGDLRWQVTGAAKNSMSYAPRSTKIENLLWSYMYFGFTAVVV